MAVAHPPGAKEVAGPSRSHPTASPSIEALGLKAAVDEILLRRPAVGLAVGMVIDGCLEFFRGHGLADVASNTPVTEDTVLRIASITKTFTAIFDLVMGLNR
jgi:CubicO group peptidase (beta-lactamase class C family)